MKRLGDTHRWWELHNGVDVIRHDTQLDHTYVVPCGDFVEDVFAKLFILLAPKHIVTVFGAPLKVVEILAYAMASGNKIHCFSSRTGFQGTRRKAGAPAQEYNK
jgi:hypothetical protein